MPEVAVDSAIERIVVVTRQIAGLAPDHARGVVQLAQDRPEHRSVTDHVPEGVGGRLCVRQLRRRCLRELQFP
jgi:hypothetical protein